MKYNLSRYTALIGLALALGLAGCGKAPVARGINDPYEAHNRAVHETNKRIDRTILKPLSGGGGGGGQVGRTVGNFAGNLTLPGSIVNDVLQANIDDAAHNFTRLLINTTFGIGGLFDPASDWGLHDRPSDFGETLHVWGAAEGHYVELPLAGPSTKRDAIGKVVDLFTNPLTWVLPSPERFGVPLASGLGRLSSRAEFGDTIDSILYESADSYAQSRLLYLENRRYKLGGANVDIDVTDPYEDPNAADPYDGIDPYAE